MRGRPLTSGSRHIDAGYHREDYCRDRGIAADLNYGLDFNVYSVSMVLLLSKLYNFFHSSKKACIRPMFKRLSQVVAPYLKLSSILDVPVSPLDKCLVLHQMISRKLGNN